MLNPCNRCTSNDITIGGYTGHHFAICNHCKTKTSSRYLTREMAEREWNKGAPFALELWKGQTDSIIVNRNIVVWLADCGKSFLGHSYRIVYSSNQETCSEELGWKAYDYIERFYKKVCNVEVSTEFSLSGSAKVYSFCALTK